MDNGHLQHRKNGQFSRVQVQFLFKIMNEILTIEFDYIIYL